MNKTTCLIHRRQPEKPIRFGVSIGRSVFGRRFLCGPAAVLAALTLSATLLPTPTWAAENEPRSATPSAPVLPLGQLRVGKSMQMPMSKGAKYEVQDGSAQVRMEAGDGYLLITPLEEGNVAFTMNGMSFGVKVVASAQVAPVPSPQPAGTPPAATAPAGGVPAATAPSSGGIQPPPTLVPVAPPPVEPLPPLEGPATTAAGVPSGMAPVSPPQVSRLCRRLRVCPVVRPFQPVRACRAI